MGKEGYYYLGFQSYSKGGWGPFLNLIGVLPNSLILQLGGNFQVILEAFWGIYFGRKVIFGEGNFFSKPKVPKKELGPRGLLFIPDSEGEFWIGFKGGRFSLKRLIIP